MVSPLDIIGYFMSCKLMGRENVVKFKLRNTAVLKLCYLVWKIIAFILILLRQKSLSWNEAFNKAIRDTLHLKLLKVRIKVRFSDLLATKVKIFVLKTKVSCYMELVSVFNITDMNYLLFSYICGNKSQESTVYMTFVLWVLNCWYIYNPRKTQYSG